MGSSYKIDCSSGLAIANRSLLPFSFENITQTSTTTHTHTSFGKSQSIFYSQNIFIYTLSGLTCISLLLLLLLCAYSSISPPPNPVNSVNYGQINIVCVCPCGDVYFSCVCVCTMLVARKLSPKLTNTKKMINIQF